MLEIVVVGDEDMPAGHDWVRIGRPDGSSMTFVRRSSAYYQFGYLRCTAEGIPSVRARPIAV